MDLAQLPIRASNENASRLLCVFRSAIPSIRRMGNSFRGNNYSVWLRHGHISLAQGFGCARSESLESPEFQRLSAAFSAAD